MNVSQPFSNRTFRWIVYAVVLVILVLLVIDIFAIGGDTFLFTLHSSLNAPLAVIVTILSASIWQYMSGETQRRQMWSGLVLGWALWALAETIWAAFSVLGQEVPYPSLADLFWVAGYIPMGVGLLTRLRNSTYQPTVAQRYWMLGVSAVTFAFIFVFIFLPIIQYFDPQFLVQSLLNIIYPLADLFLLSIIWWMSFTYEKGESGTGWRLLAFGFILMTFSDLLFTYADWYGLYYPDMKATLLSRLVIDFPYTVSYLVWIAGIFALRLLRREKRPVEAIPRVRRLPSYGHVLIFTDNEDKILSVSSNFERIFAEIDVQGKSLGEALSISEQEEQTIFTKLRFGRKAADLPITIHDRNGASKAAVLCGVAPINTQMEYAGANLVLRIPDPSGMIDSSLSRESRGMAEYVLERSESQYKAETGQFLLDYYLPFFKALLDITFQEGGEVLAKAFLEELRNTATHHNWPLQFNYQTVLTGEYPLGILREALPVLLETGQIVVSKMTDPRQVEAHMDALRTQIGEDVQEDVMRLMGEPQS